MNTIFSKPRENHVDIIKGFAIIAVVLLHINFSFTNNDVVNVYGLLGGQWHVAVFFLVSGFFLKEERLKHPWQFMKPKVKNLYLKAMWIYIPLVLLHNVFLKWGWLYPDVIYNNRYLHVFSGVEYVTHLVSQFLFFWREPFSGAMWYVDSLLFALTVYSVGTWIVSKLTMTETLQKKIVGFGIVLLATISGIASNHFGITIPKFSNVFTGLLLIYVGRITWGGHFLKSFDDKWLLALCLLVFYQYNLFDGCMALNNNKFHDMVHLVVCSWSAMYILGFIGKKIQYSWFGKTIAYVGKESFWVMGLHMVGFHAFTQILSFVGVFDSVRPHFTTPLLYNHWLLIGYLTASITFSLGLVWMTRKAFSIFK